MAMFHINIFLNLIRPAGYETDNIQAENPVVQIDSIHKNLLALAYFLTSTLFFM